MAEVSEQTEQELNVPFHFNVNVAKVDSEKRLVSGVVTAETVDKAGEVVDYATIKKYFESPELWPGNIREMHQPKAVGKRVSVEFDDANKVISMTARVSKGAPETWEKVMDGTLSMFSIGGSGDRKVEKTADGRTVKRIFITGLSEVSLVDNGANPLAKFDIVKMDGDHLVNAQPDDDEDEVIEKADEKKDEKADEETDESDEEKAKKKKAKKDEDEKPKDDGEKEDKPVEKSADDILAEKRAPLLEVVNTYMATPGVENKPRTVGVAKAVLAAVLARTDVEKMGPEPYDITQALTVTAALESLLANEYWDARYGAASGAAPDPVRLAQVQMLKTAIDAVLEFIISEHKEQFAETPNADAALPTGEMAVAMFDAAFDVMKAGARNSKADAEVIQKMHDHSIALGASCNVQKADDKAGSGDIEKAAGASVPDPTTVTTIVQSDDVQKLNRELTETRSKLQEQGDTITKLNARMDEILKMARPGGPAVRAVHKSIGNAELPGADAPSEEGAGITPEVAISTLQQLASQTNDAVTKTAIATEILKIQRATGAGRFVINK